MRAVLTDTRLRTRCINDCCSILYGSEIIIFTNGRLDGFLKWIYISTSDNRCLIRPEIKLQTEK